jgi:hypothetical protein
MKRALGVIALLGLCACEEVTPLPDTIDCTAEARVSVSVEVLDAEGSGVPAEVFYNAGDGEQACDVWGDGTYACGYEVAGEIYITVYAEGYLDAWDFVTIESDACHVIGQSLIFELEAEAE